MGAATLVRDGLDAGRSLDEGALAGLGFFGVLLAREATAGFGAAFLVVAGAVRFGLEPEAADRDATVEVLPPRFAVVGLATALAFLAGARVAGPRPVAVLGPALVGGRRPEPEAAALRLDGGRTVLPAPALAVRDEVALGAGFEGARAGALVAAFAGALARPAVVLVTALRDAALPAAPGFLAVGLAWAPLPPAGLPDFAAAEDFWSVRRVIVLA
ncbi:MAG: hypothetical protein NVSMB29_01450 [Candidatus Dormibacteria bacterium]